MDNYDSIPYLHFQEYLNTIFEAAKQHARSLEWDDPIRENIFFAIGYTRSYLETHNIIPEQEENRKL
jgi:hypothetical protein